MSHTVEGRAPREPVLNEVEGPSWAGTPGSPPASLIDDHAVASDESEYSLP
ncbi:MAG TPA: hypothetical protein VF953_02090 [Terriglobales bacterium]